MRFIDRDGFATLIAATCALVLSQSSPRAYADEFLRAPFSNIAKAVGHIAKSRGISEVAIGDFTGPATLGSASGPGIRKLLAEEFAKLEIKEKKVGAVIGVQGRYFLGDEPGNRSSDPDSPKQLQIEASIVDRNGRVLSNLSSEVDIDPSADSTFPISIKNGNLAVPVFETQTVAELLGVTVDTSQQRDQTDFSPIRPVIESLEQPTAFLRGAAVSASRNSPFTMEILVNGRPRQVKLEDGVPFVELKKEETFQIRVRNSAPMT